MFKVAKVFLLRIIKLSVCSLKKYLQIHSMEMPIMLWICSIQWYGFCPNPWDVPDIFHGTKINIYYGNQITTPATVRKTRWTFAEKCALYSIKTANTLN